MSKGQRKKSPSDIQSPTQAWSRGASRLIEQGKLMWLLGEGLNAVLEAQSQGVTPPDEAGLVGTAFNWIQSAWTGLGVPAGNPFVGVLSRKVVAVPTPGKAPNQRGPSPNERPSNLMLALGDLAAVSCPVLWIGSREVAGRWASMALAAGTDGLRRVLAIKEGSVREQDVAEGLLADLVRRGLHVGTGLLIVSEGSRTLDQALAQAGSGSIQVAHCLSRLHSDVIGHFPEATQAQRGKELSAAWSLPPTEASALLQDLVTRWSAEAPGAAERLGRSLDASLTVARLGVGSPLKERLESAGTLRMAFKKAARWASTGSGRPTLSIDSAWLERTRRLAGWRGLDLLAHTLHSLPQEPRNNAAPTV